MHTTAWRRLVIAAVGAGLLPLVLASSASAAVFVFPSAGSTVVGSVGFINANEVGYFWSGVLRGDSVSESFASDPSINSVVVGGFTVNEGFTGPITVDVSFPTIAGPVYNVALRVTNEVAPGEGSHSLAYAGEFAHSIELIRTNPNIVKTPDLANLWLCNQPADACANKESNVEEVNLNVVLDRPITGVSPKGDPQTLGAFEFEVRYDSKLVFVDWEPGELAAFMECGKVRQENALQIVCVTKTKDNPPVTGPGTLATLRVRATPDVYSILIPNQQNGIATQLINH